MTDRTGERPDRTGERPDRTGDSGVQLSTRQSVQCEGGGESQAGVPGGVRGHPGHHHHQALPGDPHHHLHPDDKDLTTLLRRGGDGLQGGGLRCPRVSSLLPGSSHSGDVSPVCPVSPRVPVCAHQDVPGDARDLQPEGGEEDVQAGERDLRPGGLHRDRHHSVCPQDHNCPPLSNIGGSISS